MKPKANSLLLSEEAWSLPTEFYSCWNARGLYNPLQFVLRLRPDIHRALNSAPSGLVSANQISEEQVLAFSTFFHENIHWWQHIGSITGFILSLIYPAQSHLNHRHLKAILSELGPIKPLRNYHLQRSLSNHKSNIDQVINIALNNWHDIEFYRWLVVDPKNIGGKVNDRYFDCVGHSYEIAIGAVLWLLSSTIDPNLEIFQDPRKWESIGRKLRNDKANGFYFGSPILLPPIGAKEIFEGQARFSQLQYLYLSSGRSIKWADFENMGMLGGIYITAFKHFLDITGFVHPLEFDDSIVGLFLLVCDISINPAEGFIEELDNFEELIEIHDPGLRFLRLCFAVREKKSHFSSSITDYSAKEYWEFSELLCALTGFKSPRALYQRVVSWPARHQSVAGLLEEDNTFNFALGNLPVRVFLARFIKYQIDKSNTPEFFCWPGVWMTAAKSHGISPHAALSLFDEHSALFLDKEDGDVYPRIIKNRDEGNINTTFNNFYSWVATYELTRQWLVGTGDFDYNFSWLTSKYSQNEIESWASSRFENAFGISSKGFNIV